MRKLSNLKLKQQLLVFALTAIISIILIEVYYYWSFSNLTKDRAYKNFENLTKQVEENINTTYCDIEEIASFVSYSYNVQKYITEEDNLNVFKMGHFVQDNLNYSNASNPNIQNIRIIGVNNRSISSSTDGKAYIYDLIIHEYDFEDMVIDKDFYTHAYLDKKTNNLYFAYVKPVYPALGGIYQEDNIAICMILCKTTGFQNLVDSIKLSPNSIFTISDNRGNIIASNNREDVGKSAVLNAKPYKSILNNGDNQIILDNNKFLVQTTRIKESGWNITALIPVEDLTRDMLPLVNVTIIILLIITVIFLTMIMIIIRNVTSPISNIVMELDYIGNKDTNHRIKVVSKNEIGSIGMYINKTLDRLDQATQDLLQTQRALYESEILQKQAELSFYQSQINPHFLYNTLECIRSIAVAHGVVEIQDISISMAKIFRYSVNGRDIVKVRDEVFCAQDYFNIISIRFMGRYKLSTDIAHRIWDINLPKMVIQPIVENAVLHGLGNRSGDGEILIKGYSDDNESNAIIEVIDNGKGIEQNRLKSINQSLTNDRGGDFIYGDDIGGKGIGLRNINYRIKLMYGEDYGLHLLSEEGQGTRVIVKIPC